MSYPDNGYPRARASGPGTVYPASGEPVSRGAQRQGVPHQQARTFAAPQYQARGPQQGQRQAQPTGWQKFMAVSSTIRTIRLFVSVGFLLLVLIIGGVVWVINTVS